jgi:hypothetical protein
VQIKHVTGGGLKVTVDLISNNVYEILDYVLNARMVSIEIHVDVCVLISVRQMVARTKGAVLPVLMDILEIVVIFRVQPVYNRK